MKKKIALVFLGLLFMAIIADVVHTSNLMDGDIQRPQLGEEATEVKLRLEVENVIEDYEYSLEVSPELPKEEQAEKYFQKAISQIDKDFAKIDTKVPLKNEYAEGIVQADWSIQPFGIVDEDGTISWDKLEKDITILQAQVVLTCGVYEKIYDFAFELNKPSPSEEEIILQKIETWIDKQMKKEGSQKVELPSQLAGEKLYWREDREFITPQVLGLEVLALLLLQVVSKRRKEEEEKKRFSEMEGDYPDVVNQLSLLLGAGMTARQAWGRIATQYEYKKKEGLMKKSSVYEAIVQMSHRFKEGERERMVYKQFTEEIPTVSYRKLVRLLLGNLEKGTAGIALQLEEESRLAFEQKILRARKLGEEASTKMLLPLMLMLLLVMGVVMMPAFMKFQI